jgi:hypothetical protein
MDPFTGTGTTLEVALRMGRSAVGIDLKAPKGFQGSFMVKEPAQNA